MTFLQMLAGVGNNPLVQQQGGPVVLRPPVPQMGKNPNPNQVKHCLTCLQPFWVVLAVRNCKIIF
jgi:hypothetical protein